MVRERRDRGRADRHDRHGAERGAFTRWARVPSRARYPARRSPRTLHRTQRAVQGLHPPARRGRARLAAASDARFVFIGIPGFYSSFFDEFARYADERIVDVERATGAEKSAALDACDVFAMPSLHETFGIGYLEAWLHERPVVGGDIPPLRDVIADGEDGFCVRQRVNDVARAIMRLLDDPALRLTMGRAGAAKLRERWDWDQVIARVEDAYARALANAHSDVDEALA